MDIKLLAKVRDYLIDIREECLQPRKRDIVGALRLGQTIDWMNKRITLEAIRLKHGKGVNNAKSKTG